MNYKRNNRGEFTPMSERSIEKVLVDLGNKVLPDRHVTVHLFRKTLGTRLYNKHVDIAAIAAILGHSSINTTIQHYVTVSMDDAKKALNY